jgi:hypothetical protein
MNSLEASLRCDCVLPVNSNNRLEPVARRYRPESTALENLVEVLSRLLLEVPANDCGQTTTSLKSTCFSKAHE